MMKIPEGYIEDAKSYSILPNDSKESIEIGGPIMMNLVVREHMEITNIVATTGLEGTACLIIVDYPTREVVRLVSEAQKYLRLINAKDEDLN